jgi:uncharacterized protein YbaA (DUF1428 family)
MTYVDGFVVPVKKDRIEDYRRIAQESAALFKEYGALSVVECVADDAPYGELTSFPRAVQLADDEIVVFSWIVYPSREVRDASNKRMMEDPRMKGAMENMPIDGKRMIFGGFNAIVEA